MDGGNGIDKPMLTSPSIIVTYVAQRFGAMWLTLYDNSLPQEVTLVMGKSFSISLSTIY